jgi:hypothetical protein
MRRSSADPGPPIDELLCGSIPCMQGFVLPWAMKMPRLPSRPACSSSSSPKPDPDADAMERTWGAASRPTTTQFAGQPTAGAQCHRGPPAGFAAHWYAGATTDKDAGTVSRGNSGKAPSGSVAQECAATGRAWRYEAPALAHRVPTRRELRWRRYQPCCRPCLVSDCTLSCVRPRGSMRDPRVCPVMSVACLPRTVKGLRPARHHARPRPLYGIRRKASKGPSAARRVLQNHHALVQIPPSPPE